MKLVKTNKANLPVTEAPTMTSLEMVDYINADRKAKAEAEGLVFPCKKYTRLQHKHFLQKVPKVLGEKQSAKFSADYIDDKGRTQPCYRFPKREACLMAMSYSYELQAQVFDHMTELEGSKDINLM
ncbi:Rha family transcriptional regulator, partial [Xenorhabdus bovienii]|nr:Rha family transcriptional regulator [Xenorhabdus bovienii]